MGHGNGLTMRKSLVEDGGQTSFLLHPQTPRTRKLPETRTLSHGRVGATRKDRASGEGVGASRLEGGAALLPVGAQPGAGSGHSRTLDDSRTDE